MLKHSSITQKNLAIEWADKSVTDNNVTVQRMILYAVIGLIHAVL